MCLPYFTVAVFLVILVAKYSECDDSIAYSIPKPRIEVFTRGFRVAIPDQDGVNLFAFHGNINVPMDDLESGHYSQDILKKDQGYWVFEDVNRKLHVGDVIYYWLFVIRFNLGYRYDNGKFVVKEIKPYKSLQEEPKLSAHEEANQSNWYFEPIDKLLQVKKPNISAVSTSGTLPPSTNTKLTPVTTSASKSTSTITIHRPISTCCQLFLNVTSQLTILSEQIDNLTEENKILKKIAEKNDYYATNLQIFGKYPTEYYPTPKEFTQNLILETLKLEGVKVMEVKKIPDNGISFKVETLDDKMKIIMAAKVRLEGTNYELSW